MLSVIKEKYIGDRKFYENLFKISFPIIIQNALTNFVNLLDNIMVGRLGTEQMSGVSIVNQITFVYYLLIFGGLSGVGIYTAQYYGNHDDEGVRTTFRFKLWLGLIICITSIMILLLFGGNLVQKFLNGSSDGGDLAATLSYGMKYMGIIVFMLPAVYIGMLYTSTMRECGQTFVPMIAGVDAIIVNCILDYGLIFGKLGLPEMGVAGAAIATVIARYAEMFIVVLWAVLNRHKHTYFKGIFRTFLVPRHLIKKYFITSMPLLINEGLWSIGVAMLAQAYSIRGLNVVAGQNIASTINNIFNIVFIAMGDAVAIIVGQYLGSGDMRKARDADNKIIAFAIFSSIIIGAIMLVLAPIFPQFYNTNDMARLVATHFIIVQGLFMAKDAFLHTSYFTIRAGGNTVITFVFDSVFMMAVSVPFAHFLCRCTTLGIAVVFALVHAADILKCIFGFILLYKGIWMKNIVK